MDRILSALVAGPDRPAPAGPDDRIQSRNGGVAQLGERRVRNAKVRSSILLVSTTIQRPTVLGWAFLFGAPGIPRSRGIPARSACASSQLPDHHRAPSSPRPIFSRNPRQFLRHGTRRWRFPSTTYACADGNDWLAGLLLHITRANSRGQPQRQPLGGNGS